MGNGAVDDRVVVGEGDRPMVGATDSAAHLTQRGAERCVVIDPGVPADPSVGAGTVVRCRRVVIGEIRLGGDDDRAGPCDGAQRVGRSFRVAVGELHIGVQTRGSPLEQRLTRLDEHLGRRHPDVGDPVLGERRADLVE